MDLFINSILKGDKMPKKIKKNKNYKIFIIFNRLVIVSISFNLFILPIKLFGGVSGIGVILNWLFDLIPQWLF